MNLDAIAATAAIVATEYETSREAIAERDTAEADLLSALVAKVAPRELGGQLTPERNRIPRLAWPSRLGRWPVPRW